MKEQEDLDHTLENAFEAGGQPVPEDRYFKKIWNSIETRAPVGEKYYLRWIFSAFFIILFLGVVGLFYSDFLSSVLTLKEIRQENAAYFNGVPPMQDYQRQELAPGLVVTSMEKTSLQLSEGEQGHMGLDFFRGHILIEKSAEGTPLLIGLPDLKLTLHRGKLNLFCYDGIIRIIPIGEPVELELKGERQVVQPGKVYYLLDGHPALR